MGTVIRRNTAERRIPIAGNDRGRREQAGTFIPR